MLEADSVEAITTTPVGTQNWYECSYPAHEVLLTTSQLKSYSVPIIGGRDCAKVSQVPKHGETFTIGENIKVTAVHTPCHTQDSICYLFEDGNDRAVFTGDTLFIGGKAQHRTETLTLC